MNDEIRTELASILEQYDLGRLAWYQRDERGTVNTSFAVETERDGERNKYFFRRYKAGVRLEELQFEHSIINYLKSNHFDIVAGVLPTRDGKTFISRSGEDDRNGVYYAIFDFLPGEDRYTWIGPACAQSEIISSAEVLATFHQIMSSFQPQGERLEPVIMDLLPMIDERITACLAMNKGNVFEDYFREKTPAYRQNLKQTLDSLRIGLDDECVQHVIHCDFHPGNLKFESGRVVGLFDLDWSKVDYRLFDVALAIYYFFVCWDEERDGNLRMPDTGLFLQSYQALLAGNLKLKPLTKTELSCLPEMIAAANLYVLNWTIMDYLHREVDPFEYLGYLKHHYKTIQWLDSKQNRAALQELVISLSDGYWNV
jgi:homoserine kinase type II